MSEQGGRSSARSRARSSPAGEVLVAAFHEVRNELVSTLYYMLGNHADAQDAAQEAFLKCWRSRDSLPEVRNLRAWVFRVALNAAKDLQRNAYRRRARPLAEAVPSLNGLASPIEEAAERELLDRLRAALLALRPEEKEVYLLRTNGCLTYEEIAELRRVPVGTVKTQMRTALQKLRQIIDIPTAKPTP